MPPNTKGKAKQVKGAASTQALKKSKQTPRVHISTGDEGGSLTDEEVSFLSLEKTWLSRRGLWWILLVDLSHWVKASETQQRTREAFPSVRPTTYHTGRRRTQRQLTPTSDREVADAVRMRVTERMRQLCLGEDSKCDEGLTSEVTTHRRRPLKSSMDRMGATMVIKNITWPHKVVYSSTGKPTAYKDLSVAAFVHGYLRDITAQHLEELMSDCDIYGWDKVRTYHGVLLNQMEQGCLSWEDCVQKLKFCWTFVWHLASPPTASSSVQPAPSYTSSRTSKMHKTAGDYNTPARPGTIACESFNWGICQKGGEHPEQQHVCSYCLATINWAYPHSATSCHRKKWTDERDT